MPRSHPVNGKLTKGGRTMPVSTMLRSSLLRGTLAVSLALPLLGAGTLRAPIAAASASAGASASVSMAAAPSMVRVPSSTLVNNTGCPVDGGTGHPTCDLWAETGSVTLPTLGTPVTVWTFVSTDGATITAPVGPTLVVTEGQPVDMVLHNRIRRADDVAGAAADGRLRGRHVGNRQWLGQDVLLHAHAPRHVHVRGGRHG